MTEISCYIIKPFPFSRDGIKQEEAHVSSTIDIPGRLFDGLNREGYVRRAVIGDGHISLDPVTVFVEAAIEPALVGEAPGVGVTHLQPAKGPEVVKGATTPAPQPASATAELNEKELAALADGTWKSWPFFTKRSVAAKISDQPVVNGDDANAAIEAYIAPKDL